MIAKSTKYTVEQKKKRKISTFRSVGAQQSSLPEKMREILRIRGRGITKHPWVNQWIFLALRVRCTVIRKETVTTVSRFTITVPHDLYYLTTCTLCLRFSKLPYVYGRTVNTRNSCSLVELAHFRSPVVIKDYDYYPQKMQPRFSEQTLVHTRYSILGIERDHFCRGTTTGNTGQSQLWKRQLTVAGE